MLVQDLRFAIRQIRRAPGFAATVAVTLALSVGVATAVFCVIDAVILRPLPYTHSKRIVDIDSRSDSGYTQPASWPSYTDERAQAKAFAALAGYADFDMLTVDTPSGGPMLFAGVMASENFFDVFGVAPLFGRTFLKGDEQQGKNDIAVLSYELWQEYFGGDKGVLNHAVKVNGHEYTIIGVMPAGFRFPLRMRDAIYIPVHLSKPWMKERGTHWLRTVARLNEGVSVQMGQADLAHVFTDLGRAYKQDEGRTVHLVPLAQSITGTTRGPLWTLLAAVLAVLAIGCVNIAGLLLARGVKREREMAMRTAVGATRGRIVRQLLTESLILAGMGAVGAVVLAVALLDAMRVFLIHALSRGTDVQMNWTVLGAAIAAAVLASVGAAMYPALRISRVDPSQSLKAGGAAGTQRGQHAVRAGFIVTQVALTLVLLTVSALLIRMLTRYRHADLGFDPAHILVVDINLSPDRYEKRDPIADFYQPVFDRLSRIAAVRAVGVIDVLPIQSWGSNSDIHIAGQPPYPPHQEMLAEGRMVSTGYFDVFGIPLRQGRTLSPALDLASNPSAAVVVNEAFVRKFMPKGLDPVGQRIDDADREDHWTRIVGVTGNVRQDIYEAPLAERDWLFNGLPLEQRASQLSAMAMVLRVDGDPKSIIPAVRAGIHEVDPTVPFKTAYTMTDVVARTLIFERMESWLFAIFAGLALVLALVGLYGLVSHEVEQSTRDIGLRMALGATRPRILRMTLSRVAWMLCGGAALGLVLTLIARKLIGVVIYFDAGKETGGLLLLALVVVLIGLAAALIPAARSARIEPMQALRTE